MTGSIFIIRFPFRPWWYSVVVSISGCGPLDPGSNPGTARFLPLPFSHWFFLCVSGTQTESLHSKPNQTKRSYIKRLYLQKKKTVFEPGIEPGTLSVLDSRDNQLHHPNLPDKSILGRVVKAMDLSPIGHSPREFDPRRMHYLFLHPILILRKNKKKEIPMPGFEPGSPGWKPGILTN